ncbi:MAG: DUF3488 domain-containing protein [Bdellovibrionales bacterium]
MKLVDSAKYRDAMVALFLNFLLLMAKFLVSQTLAMTLFAVFNLVVITALLFQLHKGKSVKFDLVTLLRNGLKLTMQTAPLLILLFFVFPRFNIGFFSLNDPDSASTGFSGELRPGEVSRLVVSKETAFRAKIKGGAPNTNNLYWRGETLELTQGMNWSKEKQEGWRLNKFEPDTEKNLIEQEITLEPRYGKWLFALDTPAHINFEDYRKQTDVRAHMGRTSI